MREIVNPSRSIRITMQLSVCGLAKCRNAFVLMLSECSIGNKIELVKQFSADIATPHRTVSFIPAVGYVLVVYSLLDFPKPHFVGLVEWHTRVRCIHGALPEVEMVSCPEALGTQFGFTKPKISVLEKNHALPAI
jgi:hypothetical protein